MKQHTPLIVSTILMITFAIRVVFITSDVTGWFISMLAMVTVICIGLLVKELIK